MSEELKPCPFCGQQDAFVEQLDSDASVVICQGMVDENSACLSRGPVGVQQSDMEDQPGREAAIAEWNRRAQPAEAEGVAVVGVVCVSRFKNNPAVENVEFHLAADLPQGQNEVVLHSAHLAALSAVTAERDGANERAQMILDAKNHWADRARAAERERDQLRAELETVKKVAYGNLELLDENAKLRAEVDPLLALLGKSLPVVEAHAGASHMLDGFRPIRNKWDELVDEIRAAMAAKEA